jgi:hypothetical protein
VANYRYLFVDLLGNTVQAELSLTQVNFTQALNSSGALQGSILLSGLPEGTNVIGATVPAFSGIYVERDGVLVWGGVIWSREYNSDSEKLAISAEEFESYFKRRLITQDLIYDATDQFDVANGIVNAAQAQTAGNIGVITTAATSGVLVSRSFYAYELKSVLSALQDLSKSSQGFDFRIKVAYDNNRNPTKELELGYPRLGTVYSSTNVNAPVFEFPAGNIVSYAYPEDGSIVANKVWVSGAGSNEGKLVYYAADTSKLTNGWALLENSASYSDIDDPDLLANLAAGQVAAVSYPPSVVKVVANPSTDPVFGSYDIGDDVRLRILDDRFPNGLDAIYRLTALSVTAGESGPERVTLTLTLPTS